MSYSILGLPLDIHAGGQDLIFPHHEDEIAQSEAGYGEKFANYWMHNGMVNVNKIKMSKSLGNFKTIRNLLKIYKPEVIRYFVISNHYRKPIDFSEKTLENAKNSYDRIKNICSEIDNDNKENNEYIKEFEKAMDDDLNTPNALQILWKLLRDEKAHGKYKTIEKMDNIFGLRLLEKDNIKISSKIKNLIKEREKAREVKNWKKADEIREKIKEEGYEIIDGKEGWEIKEI
jgi:cysteinyl-tRNA synthetase